MYNLYLKKIKKIELDSFMLLPFMKMNKCPFMFTENEVTDFYSYTEPDIYPIVDSFYKNLKVEEE